MQGLIHYNCNLQHQIDHAQAFRACGFDSTPSPYVEMPGVHVISGPYFAYDKWKNHPQTLMIDRAWWGDPDCVSIGWLQPDGTRKFATGTDPRAIPEIEPWRTGESSVLILADYDQDTTAIKVFAQERFETVTIRRHPAEHPSMVPLTEALMHTDVCIGHSGSALFDAIRMGVPTICTDPLNECIPACSSWVNGKLYRGSRDAWLHDMSYKQFSLAEIADGTAWRLLKDIQ